MKFSLLLKALSMGLKFISWKYSSFKEKLKEKNITMLIKTKEGDRARYYTFNDGSVISKGKIHPEPDVSLVWADAATGYNIMLSKDNDAPINALNEGKLQIEGDANLALWFMGIVKRMQSAAKDNRKSK